MNRAPAPACPPTPTPTPSIAHCNLCGSGMHAAHDGHCPACASTAPGRAMRSVFQALPLGLLARRRLVPRAGPHGLDPRWFAAAAPDGAELALIDQPDQLDTLGAQAVACLAPLAAITAQERAHAMTAWLALNCLPCSVIALEVDDPGSGARLCATLLLRQAADGARWRALLRAWHGTAALASGVAPCPFAPLRAELACWEAAGERCAFWWRDDDLVADSPALRRLAALSQRHAAPVLVAAIPAQADADLARATEAGMPTLVFCQHGWAHANHAPPGQPNSEFGAAREPAAALADLARGSARMRALFGQRFLPVMVPPWNRLAPALAPRLPELGLHGLSQYLSEPALEVDGLVRVDTHLDILDWRTGGGVSDPCALVERLVTVLRMRRSGQLREPVGILSHHRVMAEGSWRFLERLLAQTRHFPGVRWLHPHEVFGAMSALPAAEVPCAA
jgi:hypothetical protein